VNAPDTPLFSEARAIAMFKQLYTGPTPGTPLPSPDGRRIAFLTQRIDWGKNKNVTELAVKSCRSGSARVLRHFSFLQFPRWANDGKTLFFLGREKESQVSAIYRWKLADPKPIRLIREKEPITAFAGDPVSGLYYVTAPADTKGTLRATVHFPKAVAMGRLKRYPGKKTVVPIEKEAGALTISPDGKSLAYLIQPTPYPESAFATEVHAVDLARRQRRRIGQPNWGVQSLARWGATTFAFSPQGNLLAVMAQSIPGVYPARADIFLVDLKTNRCRNLSGRHDTSAAEILGWTPDGASVLAVIAQGMDFAVAAFDLKGKVRILFAGYNATAGLVNGQVTHRLVGDAKGPLRICGPGFSGRRPHCRCCPQRIIRWTSREGWPLEGVLYEPRHRRPPYPTLLFIHGGPASPVNNTATRMEYFQTLAAAGVAVFVPAFRGTGGYSQAFLRANIGDFTAGPLQDMMRGLDALVRDGMADEKRLAVMGISYGGTMALWALTRTRRFKAGICLSGTYDLASDAGTTARGPYASVYLKKFYWQNPRLYLRNSASGAIQNLHAPLLLLHGEADTNTPLSNAKEAAYALRNLKREFRFKSYEGEGHGMDRPGHRVDVLRECVQWLNLYLR